MNSRFKLFVLFWLLGLTGQSLLVMLCFGQIANDLPFQVWVSYWFPFGYVLSSVWGVGAWGPLDLDDVRWIAGTILLLSFSLVAVVHGDAKWRIVFGGLLLGLYLVGSLFSIYNMVGALT